VQPVKGPGTACGGCDKLRPSSAPRHGGEPPMTPFSDWRPQGVIPAVLLPLRDREPGKPLAAG